MPLKSIMSYKSAFSLVQLISVVVVLASAATCVLVYKMFTDKISELSSVIYIMDGSGSVNVAERQPLNLEQRLFEYEDHVKDFYSLWYAFDEHSFERNVEKALYLAGECGVELLDVYKEEQVLSKLQEKNLKITVKIEDVVIDISTRPVSGVVKGRQTIRRLGGSMSRRMDCRFSLHDVDRSRQNPHGVKIENWTVADNSKIENE